MTLAAFCKRTGWPLREFLSLPYSEAVEIGALYGLQLVLRRRSELALGLSDRGFFLAAQ